MFMNRQECDVLMALEAERFETQRELAERCGLSLGAVNRALRTLRENGMLDGEMRPSEAAQTKLDACAPKRAVLLAAGFGLRMIPINRETPKPLLEVHGEVLIERLIRQLWEVGVREISVVVGFMKERFEYLIDAYGVELIVNPAYAAKNNLHSLALATGRLDNAYIVPCDLWCCSNPFRTRELYSWYLVGEEESAESELRINRRHELVATARSGKGNAMIGIAYLLPEQAALLRERMARLCADERADSFFWEAAMTEKGSFLLPGRTAAVGDVVEINTYEQLRELDGHSAQLKSEAMEAVAAALKVSQTEIREIAVLKKGMTNRSFLFSCSGQRYIMRVPGEGTDRLINRRQEAAVYAAIAGRGLCDEPVYLEPSHGYKITRYLEGVRCCDAENEQDLRRCMEKLRAFHRMNLQVEHRFDLFGQIEFYESLWKESRSVYRDYEKTKAGVLALRPYIEAQHAPECLTHIDAVADNFLFHRLPDGMEALQLTDWEYAGMQDPHVDLAMFSIYALYERAQIDHLIDLYFEPDGGCDRAVRRKIYCYVAVCGLLWSNWCEFKRGEGVEFGEYSLRQYRYAKDFARLAMKEEEGTGCTE